MINSILSKYKKINLGIKVSIWFAFCNFFQKGIAMLSVPIFTRLMSTEDYGMFSVYQSWYSILTIVVTLNLFAGVFNKGLVKFSKNRDEFTLSMQALSTATTVLFFIIYVVAIRFWTKVFGLSPIYIFSMFFEMLLVPAYYYWSARQRFEYKYKNLVIVTIIISVLSPLIGVIAVINSKNKAVARVVSYALVQGIIGMIFFIYNTHKGKKIQIKKYWKYALAFNIPLIPHYLSQIVLNQADRIMINNIVGSREAAIYSVAYNISSLMALITNAINSTFIPSMYNSLKTGNHKKIYNESKYVAIIAVIMSVGVMLFGPELIKIFAPADYYDARWIIPPVAMGAYLFVIFSIYVNIEFYFEKTRYVMYVSVIGAIINIILNYFFIRIYGYLAAGYTTLICYTIFLIGHYLLYKIINKKYLKNAEITNNKFFATITCLLFFVMFIILVLYKYIVLRYIIIALIVIILLINARKIIDIIKCVLINDK